MCENDQCVNKEEVSYYVQIEVEGIKVSDMNMTEIQITISDLTGINVDEIRIQVDVNDRNEVIHIIVIVNDRTTAEIIKDAINVAIEHCSSE